MKLFARSVCRYIRDQAAGQATDDAVLVVIPALPAEATLEVGRLLEDEWLAGPGLPRPLFKIARELRKQWGQPVREAERSAAARIEERDEWCEYQGSLTAVRNGLGPLTVLVGVDLITDRSGLADFHHCGPEVVWGQEMEGSFTPWVREVLTGAHIAYETDTYQRFDEVLKPLVDRGLADILQVSSLLETMDLAACQDGRDAERLLLRSLGLHRLPHFTGYRFGSHVSFGPYLDDAVGFYSYDAFMEARPRDKALRAIDAFLQEKGNQPEQDWFSPDAKGDFADNRQFVQAVQEYAQSNRAELRGRLLGCDYVAIRDEILGFKGPRKPRTRDTVSKLSGGPLDVLLTGLWRTLESYKAEAAGAGLVPHEALVSLSIRTSEFKHDLGGDTKKDQEWNAGQMLARFLGGVEEWLRDGLELSNLVGDDRGVALEVALTGDWVRCVPAGSAEPSLVFSVSIDGDGLGKPVERQFAWRLPAIHPYRIADEMLEWAAGAMADPLVCHVPVFTVPYYEELMLAKDAEETTRVLQQGLESPDSRVLNLLDAPGLPASDPLLWRIEELGRQYVQFLMHARDHGLHAALLDAWQPLSHAYREAARYYLHDETGRHSFLGPLLFRAFLLIADRKRDDNEWFWERFEPSAIVTLLHPALLEMIQAQAQYLRVYFPRLAARELRAPGTRSFRNIVWGNYLDLASLYTPLCGLLVNQDCKLDTSVSGEGFVHRLGCVEPGEASLTTRLLLRYDAFEEEDIPDAELFRESREATLIRRILSDYRELHPQADDGLSLAVYQNRDVQPLIAALDGYLREVCDKRDPGRAPYALSVTILSESGDEGEVKTWLSEWRARWEAAESQASLKHYRSVELSAAHRLLATARSDGQKRREREQQFLPLLASLDVDVVILNGFMAAGDEGGRFETVPEYYALKRTLKFPVLEKPFCASRDPGQMLRRERVLSNRQFLLGSEYTEIMARLRHPDAVPEAHHLVMGSGDYAPWQTVVDGLHQRADWVVCIDPCVDERLLSCRAGDGDAASGAAVREIIGFGSGVGSHGEANYTVSTEQFRLSDILRRLKPAIRDLYGGWDAATYDTVAESVLREAQQLSGLSLVRATGLGQHIHDFMAYALTRKLLHAPADAICDQLISLDAYQHWFDTSLTSTRPDLLWLVVLRSEDGRLQLNARLFECKLARQPDYYLDEARLQLENGLDHLVEVFLPCCEDAAGGDDARPDQRYWWLQLQRLVASKGLVQQENRESVLAALERLTDGDYDICWGGAVVCFWTDRPGEDIDWGDEWNHSILGQQMPLGVVSVSNAAVPKICQPGHGLAAEFGGSLCFRAARHEDSEMDEDETADELDEQTAAAPVIPPSTWQAEPIEAPSPQETPVAAVPTVPDQPEAAPVAISVPERILIGTSVNGAREVYWEFGHEELANRHLLVFGASGMGKTYAIQCLLQGLGQSGQSSLIVDYTDGFFDHQLDPHFVSRMHPTQHIVRLSPLPLNPFRQQANLIGQMELPESPINTASRVAGVFAGVYQMGEQQTAALYQAVLTGIQSAGPTGMTLSDLAGLLEALAEQGGTAGQAAGSVLSKIRPFLDQNPFGQEQPESWERLFTDPEHRCHVLQLAGFLRDTSRLITEFALIDLYWFYRGRGTKDVPRVLVLDEVQNLDHREDSPLAQLLREGRKFGFSLILATQNLSNLSKDERDRLFNAEHKLFFRPVDTEIGTYAGIIAGSIGGKAEDWAAKLARLQKGECYSVGPSLNTLTGALETKAFHTRVTPLGERIADA
ncbi:MAG: DUF87 domain-containing protein [Armatimonadia bacterium]